VSEFNNLVAIVTGGASGLGAATVVDHFGSLDIVINNAGIGASGDLSANDDAEVAQGARR
jgi:2-keto-3-deoxy-L-fuconate dehydrogenase